MTKKKTSSFFYASFTLIGYTVGAGIFGLPFIMQRFGFFPAVWLMVFLAIVAVINCLALIEIVLRQREKHYFVKTAEKYLGKNGRYLGFFVSILGSYGALLAYFILGGVFLKNLIDPLLFLNNELVYVLLFILMGIVFVWNDLEKLGKSQIVMNIVLFFIVFIISIASLFQIKIENFKGFNSSYFLPALGVLVFAFDGTGVVFILREIMNKEKNKLSSVVWKSYGIIFFIYLIFTFSLVGIYGNLVPKEAVTNLASVLGRFFEKIALVFGFLIVFSSFLVSGSNLKNTFMTDFKIHPYYSWLLVWIIPLFLYVIGFNNFIALISLLGIVLGTINTFLIALILQKARERSSPYFKPKYQLPIPIWVNYGIVVFYILGMFYEISIFVQ